MATHYLIKKKNTLIRNATIEYILLTERFEEPLIYSEFPSESLNTFRSFLQYFIYIFYIYLPILISYIFFIFIYYQAL